MELKINEVAKLTGVTVRTLHYYDEINLLKPCKITEAGYRIYGGEELERLQQILFFKELDFPLNNIKEMISNPSYDKNYAMKCQKKLLTEKRNRLNNLIGLIENILKGEENMSFKEFDMTEIENHKKKYEKEVKERWGNTDAYRESEAKTSSYSKEQWQNVTEKGNEIMKEFAEIRSLNPSDEKAQALVKKWQNHITESFYNCTDEILAGLGMMYVSDERFTENIDKFGEGTAEFMSKAIEIYCKK